MGEFAYILNALRPHHRRLAVAIVAWLGMMLVDLGSPLVLAIMIDVIVGQGRYDWLVPLMLVFATLPFAAAIMSMLSSYLMTLVGQRLVLGIRLDLYRRVQRLSCRYLQNTTTGKLMERLRGDINQLQMLLTADTPALVVQTLTGLIMVGIMFSFSVRLTLLVLLATGLYVFNYKWFVRRIRVVQRRYRRKMDRLSSMAHERLSGNTVVKIFANERREMRGFVRHNFVTERILHRFQILNLAYGTTSNAIAWSTYLSVMVLGTLLAVHGKMTYGAVTAMCAFTVRLLSPALQLSELSNQIQQARISLSRIFELMNAEPDVIDRGGKRLDGVHGRVEFRGVSFHYKPDEPVLTNLDLSVSPGQTVALVGPTGGGKTTIASLIYRYFDVVDGTILIDGHELTSLDTRWYRRRLAMVPQDPIVFDTTIDQNIAYGRSGAAPHEVEGAARSAELGSLIDRLPDGLGTKIGDGGVRLSVGEKQRLCIARAILADPSILILDEATSSLDSHSEALIQRALKRVMANRTCFVIAHRLSTIVEADLIAVMANGRIAQLGSHDELMSNPDGSYHRMMLSQMRPGPRVPRTVEQVAGRKVMEVA